VASFKLKEKSTLIAAATSISHLMGGLSSNKAMYIQHLQIISKKPTKIWRGRSSRSSKGFRIRLVLTYNMKDLVQVLESLNQGRECKWREKAQIIWLRALGQTLLDLDLLLPHAVEEAISLTTHYVQISEAQPLDPVDSTLQEVQI